MPSSVSKLTTSIREFVDAHDDSNPMLPCVHVVGGYVFSDLLKASDRMSLVPKFCRVLERELIYLFYGRPAYRPAKDEDSSIRRAHDPYLPVAFVLKPQYLASLPETSLEVYPFDTGAFSDRLYERHIDYTEYCLEDFELTPSSATPPRMVQAFHGSNTSYITAREPTFAMQEDALNFQVKQYKSLVTDRGDNNFDGRATAVEVHVLESVPLDDSSLHTVIMPMSYADSKLTQDRLVELGVEPQFYADVDHLEAAAYTSILYDRVVSTYKQAGWM